MTESSYHTINVVSPRWMITILSRSASEIQQQPKKADLVDITEVIPAYPRKATVFHCLQSVFRFHNRSNPLRFRYSSRRKF